MKLVAAGPCWLSLICLEGSAAAVWSVDCECWVAALQCCSTMQRGASKLATKKSSLLLCTMTLLRLLFAVTVSLSTLSCANVPTDFKFDPSKPKGLVIGSITYESGLGKFYLVATSPSSPRPVEFYFGCAVWPCVEPSDDPAFSATEVPKQRGGGFAVEVPEGTYRIVAWRVARGSIHSRSTTPINIEFAVERGKSSYIGNLHFDADWEDVKLRDRAQRDIPLLKGKYPVLNSATTAFTIAPGMEVGKLGGSFQTRVSTPIFIPIVR